MKATEVKRIKLKSSRLITTSMMSLCLLGSGTLIGCASKPYTQGYATKKVVTNARGVPNLYKVKRGDTVSEIAQKYGLNYREIGAINGLDSRYTIHVGQWLTLWQNNGVRPSSKKVSPVVTSSPTPVSSAIQKVGSYIYPTTNAVYKNFDGSVGQFGMWFAGRKGDPVVASQSGRVLYAGNELAEYGNLVMIRHDASYITAYAHLNQILVSEGELVRQGKRIATMGDTGDAKQVALEFQVRKDGTPIDPLAVLTLK